MAKKIINLVAILFIGFMAFVGCSSGTSNNATNVENNAVSTENNAGKTDKIVEEKKLMSSVDFENLLLNQPVSVESTEYIVQDENLKSLYPDMLAVSIKNNSDTDIKNVVISFVAWDENNLPVKIKAQFDYSDGSYIRETNYSDINLIPGGVSDKNKGFAINELSKIKTFKAIVKSYETFDGTIWENPYYDEFCSLFEGKKLTDDMTIEVKLDNTGVIKTPEQNNQEVKNVLSEEELNSQLSQQPLVITGTEYVVQDENLKSLYPDMLAVSIKNNSDTDIKNAVISFVAWDENNLPVKIKAQFDYSDGKYIKNINYSDINLIPGGISNKDGGLAIDQSVKIKTFKAIVKSYETFDGTIWENPYYDEFCTLYEGRKIN